MASTANTALTQHTSSSSQLGRSELAGWSSSPAGLGLTCPYSCDCRRNSGESCWATATSTSQAAGAAGAMHRMGLFLWATSLHETPRWQPTQPLAGRGHLCRALGSAHQLRCPQRQLVPGCAGRERAGCGAAGIRSLPVPFPGHQPRLTGSCSAHHSRRCAGWAPGRTRRSPAQLLQGEQRCWRVRDPLALSALRLGVLLAPTSPGLSGWLVGTGHAPTQGQLVQEP